MATINRIILIGNLGRDRASDFFAEHLDTSEWRKVGRALRAYRAALEGYAAGFLPTRDDWFEMVSKRDLEAYGEPKVTDFQRAARQLGQALRQLVGALALFLSHSIVSRLIRVSTPYRSRGAAFFHALKVDGRNLV